MSTVVKESGGGDFKLAPAGLQVARCVQVADLGTQHGEYAGTEFWNSKIMLTFELPEELIADKDGTEKPMLISKEYTASLSEKANLRKDLISWRGKEFTQEELDGFDVAKVVGVQCMLNIVHRTSNSKKVYATIAGISGLPKGMTCPPMVHPPVVYDISMGTKGVFETLPDWIRKKIMECKEFAHPNPPDTEGIDPEAIAEEVDNSPTETPF